MARSSAEERFLDMEDVASSILAEPTTSPTTARTNGRKNPDRVVLPITDRIEQIAACGDLEKGRATRAPDTAPIAAARPMDL